jgi:hypothetical protein
MRVVRPDGDWGLDALTWVPGERVLVARAVVGRLHLSTTIYVVRVSRSGATWTALRDLVGLSCRDPALIAPVATAQRSFAFIEGCLAPGESPRTSKYIREFSFSSKRLRTLFSYGLPFSAGGFALEPGLKRGLLNDGTGLQEKLRWLRPDRLSAAIPLRLERVGNPTRARTGGIAIPGVMGIGDVQGPARSPASRWRLYLADAALSRLRHVGEREFVEQPPWVAWSPDGAVLALAGQTRSGRGEAFLLRPQDGREVVVAEGLYGAVAWIGPSQLAVVRHRAYSGLGGDVIEILDVSDGLDALRK